MKRLLRAVPAGWCAALCALSMGAEAQTTHNVTVGNNFFSPSNITIQVGDTVRWTNAADNGPAHNVTGDWGSSQTAESFVYSFTFNSPGLQSYLCTIHPSMSGSVNVEGGGGGNNVDLVLSEVSVDSNSVYAPGDPLDIAAEVNNAGTTTSPGYAIDFFASTDFNITQADIFLGTTNRGALGAGNNDNINVNFNLPDNLAAGDYFIGAIIDISDTNNGNNSNADDEPITVQGGEPVAELVLQAVSAPDGPHQQGATISIQTTTTNTGNLDSTPYTINFYASSNNIISPTDTLIGSASRPALGAGVSDSTSSNVMIPPDLTPGGYFIGAILDIVDTNASNNVNVDATPVQIIAAPGVQFFINHWLNDAWFNAATAGQGFFITVFPEVGAIFLAWFTYDTSRPDEAIMAFLGEAGHRWLTAFGNYEGNIASLEIELTQGGVFNSETPVPQQGTYGTIELEFIDCNNAIVHYNIPSLGLMGEIPITRIAEDNVPRCLAEQPQ